MAKDLKPLLRYLADSIRVDLQSKMVFLGGPRQVGKTTLALSLLKADKRRHPGYLNWDDPRVRPELLRGNLPANESLVVLDEIHKYPRWRNLVKGLYDTRGRPDFFSRDRVRATRSLPQGRRLPAGTLPSLPPSSFFLERVECHGIERRLGGTDAVRGISRTASLWRGTKMATMAEGEIIAGGVRRSPQS